MSGKAQLLTCKRMSDLIYTKAEKDTISGVCICIIKKSKRDSDYNNFKFSHRDYHLQGLKYRSSFIVCTIIREEPSCSSILPACWLRSYSNKVAFQLPSSEVK